MIGGVVQLSYKKLNGNFESLFVVSEVERAFGELDEKVLNKVFSELLFFNEYGTHTQFYKVQFLQGEDYKDIFEIKVKLSSKREYRILATKCSNKKRPADYLLLHAFFKKDKEITNQDKKLARNRMIREGL